MISLFAKPAVVGVMLIAAGPQQLLQHEISCRDVTASAGRTASDAEGLRRQSVVRIDE